MLVGLVSFVLLMCTVYDSVTVTVRCCCVLLCCALVCVVGVMVCVLLCGGAFALRC